MKTPGSQPQSRTFTFRGSAVVVHVYSSLHDERKASDLHRLCGGRGRRGSGQVQLSGCVNKSSEFSTRCFPQELLRSRLPKDGEARTTSQSSVSSALEGRVSNFADHPGRGEAHSTIPPSRCTRALRTTC